MFSFDALDCMPTPFSDVQPSSPTSTDSSFDSYIDAAPLDQTFCSNFSCCGQRLPDLHRLLEHFEEEHVLPLPYDARPLYSSPVYAHPRPSGPYTSYILSYPQPDPPLQPVSHPIPSQGAPRALPDLDVSHHPPVPDLTYSPVSAASSTVPSCFPSPTLGEPLCLPPALFTFQKPRAYTPDACDDDADDDAEAEVDRDVLVDTPLSPTRAGSRARSASGQGAGPHRTARFCSAARIDPVPIARTRPIAIARTPERERVHRDRKKDGREKQFKCPHPGCTKSYLNPNGLKYHLEKGTCTNADVRPREALPSLTSAPASAPSPTPAPAPAPEAERSALVDPL
ncbi:hypothetical protein C8Q76DRAFT_800365 [Earliella scabrosa]|nr:hypothetical protein C8Q76DRAFT_800365 [Earliella scabrosa]